MRNVPVATHVAKTVPDHPVVQVPLAFPEDPVLLDPLAPVHSLAHLDHMDLQDHTDPQDPQDLTAHLAKMVCLDLAVHLEPVLKMERRSGGLPEFQVRLVSLVRPVSLVNLVSLVSLVSLVILVGPVGPVALVSLVGPVSLVSPA